MCNPIEKGGFESRLCFSRLLDICTYDMHYSYSTYGTKNWNIQPIQYDNCVGCSAVVNNISSSEFSVMCKCT